MFKTGYFANWRRPFESSKVHVVDIRTGEPWCGANIGPKSEFQWCASGIAIRYLTCLNCIKKLERGVYTCPSCGTELDKELLQAAVAQLAEA